MRSGATCGPGAPWSNWSTAQQGARSRSTSGFPLVTLGCARQACARESEAIAYAATSRPRVGIRSDQGGLMRRIVQPILAAVLGVATLANVYAAQQTYTLAPGDSLHVTC